MKKSHINKKHVSFIFCIVLATFFLSACSKDEDADNNGYTINFEADGVLQEFTSKNNLSGLYLNGISPYRLTLEAENTSSAIYITVYDKVPLAKKTFDGYRVNRSASQVSIEGPTLGYQKEGVNYSTPAQEYYSKVRLDIEEMTSNTVRGTFSGTLLRDAVEVVITNGKFYMPYKTSN